MIKKTIPIALLLCAFLFTSISSFAQSSDTLSVLKSRDSMIKAKLSHCGLSGDYLNSKNTASSSYASLALPSSYSSSSIEVCNHFSLYYEDVNSSTGVGYDDPTVVGTKTLGQMRRENLCMVITYIESVFDFSALPIGAIRIHVDNSSLHARLGSVGLPFYTIPSTPTHPTINGFVADYVKTGIDPIASTMGFHGEIGIDFAPFPYLFGSPITHYIGMNSDYYMTSSCDFDLFNIELHQMAHVLGFFSFIKGTSPSGYSAPYSTVGPFTNLDLSLSTTAFPLSATAPFASISNLVTSTGSFSPSVSLTKQIWINGNQPPYNEAIDERSFPAIHIADEWGSFDALNRISPGEQERYIMGKDFAEGVYRRSFTKGEIETFINIIGYSYSTSFPSSLAANHKPYSSKMSSDIYNHVYQFHEATEVLPEDITMVNDVGASIVIDLNSDHDLKDDDNDHLSIYPGSLVNYRGCGDGGNNHKLLAINPTNDQITYSPRHNFYGRAQFGFNLYDGKEKGAFVIYTIDVQKGNNVFIPTGTNMVLNGDFEEGSEVKLLGSTASESINNSFIMEGGIQRGRFGNGNNMADAHPLDVTENRYWGGVAIKSSADVCSGTYMHQSFGSFWATFPYTFTSYLATYSNMLPPISGNRYEQFGGENLLLYLGDEVKPCKRYTLEFNARRNVIPTSPPFLSLFSYPPIDQVAFGFTDDAHIVPYTAYAPGVTLSSIGAGISWMGGTPYIYSPTNTYGTVPYLFSTAGWRKFSFTFSYCGSTPANILHVGMPSSSMGAENFMSIDDISLVELPDEVAINVSIKKEMITQCQIKLTAVNNSYGCAGGVAGMSYSWTESGSPVVLSTSPELNIAPFATTTYVLTVTDACGHSGTSSITVAPLDPSACLCAPSNVFGTTSLSVYGGVLPTSLSSGYYYIASDILVSSNTTLTGANVQIAPDVKITVAPNAKLTLDNTHLFTCPLENKMWQGIILSSAAGQSATIEVKNNSLIEDANQAILCVNPITPSSGNIIACTGSTFNRNGASIVITNYTAATPTLYPFDIENNVVTCRLFNQATFTGYPNVWPSSSSLKMAIAPPVDAKPSFVLTNNYPEALCKNNAMSYFGFDIENVGYTSTGLTYSGITLGGGNSHALCNLFDNLRYGIYSYNSNTLVQNSKFLNIKKRLLALEPIVGVTWGGIGVFARNTSPSPFVNKLQVQETTPGYNESIRFHDCYNAVYTDKVPVVQIIGTVITSSHVEGGMVPGALTTTDTKGGTAIIIDNQNNHTSCEVRSNKISNIHSGILVSFDRPKADATTNIDFNKFTGVNPDIPAALTTNQYMNLGIQAYMSMDGPGNTTLTTNYNNMYPIRQGILINVSKKMKVNTENNSITLQDMNIPTARQYGINFTNTISGTIYNNKIYSYTNNVTSDYITGVFAQANTGLSVCSNTTNKIGRGFEFAGGAGAVQSGTRWVLNTMNDGLKGFVLGCDIGHQAQMRYVGAFTSYWAAAGNVWTGFTAPSSYNTYVSNSLTKSINSQLYVRSSSGETPWKNYAFPMTNGYIYMRSLQPSQNLANCEGKSYPIIFRPPPIGMPMPLALMVLADSLGYDSTTYAQQWMNQLALYELGIQYPELQDSSSVFYDFMHHPASNRFKWISDMGIALSNADTSWANSLLSSMPSATGRTVVSADLVITDYADADYVVNNYRNFFRRYLKHLKGTMSCADTIALNNLAQKCPSVDGAIVYQARALYASISQDMRMYRDDSCAYGVFGLYRKTNEQIPSDLSQLYTLYPNPNNGNFVIKQNLVEDRTVMLKVYNAIGSCIYENYLNFKDGSLSVQLPQPIPGLYLVCIGDAKDRNACLRFVIK